jgi:DNA/RNA endonuclease G (NUC1)
MKNIIIFLFLLSIKASAQLELPKVEPGDEIVRHSAYTLKYNEKYEQADWVSYKLDKSLLITNTPAKRNNAFKADPRLPAIYSIRRGSSDDQGE